MNRVWFGFHFHPIMVLQSQMTEAAGRPSRIEVSYREGKQQIKAEPCAYFILRAPQFPFYDIVKHSFIHIFLHTICRPSTWLDISGEPFWGQEFVYE